MDDELRQAFATLSSQMSDVGNDARQAVALVKQNAHETAQIAAVVHGLQSDVGQLKSAVFGSNPPPPAAPAVVKRITQGEGDVAELAGQVIAVKAEVEAVKENQAKAAEERAQTAEDVRAIKEAVVGVVTNKKVRFVGRVVFMAAVAFAAAKGMKVLP